MEELFLNDQNQNLILGSTTRRTFIKKMIGTGAMLTLGGFEAFGRPEKRQTKLTILHTNDVHSRIDPFPLDGGKTAGRGGAIRRASLISEIRETEKNVLLFDAGDIFQGTPYFNFYKGEPEIKLMSAMGYDACTMGNHDFDNGIEGFEKQITAHASFPVLVANYNFDNTALQDKTLNYKIFKVDNLKIGVFGIGIELDGLVPKKLYGETQYLDPIEKANKTANFLRYEEGCSLVVCLSHLGYKYENKKISDLVLAEQSKNIDLIIGGHTHTFLNEPMKIQNQIGKQVLVNQVGWAGLQLGRLDFVFDKISKKTFYKASSIKI